MRKRVCTAALVFPALLLLACGAAYAGGELDAHCFFISGTIKSVDVQRSSFDLVVKEGVMNPASRWVMFSRAPRLRKGTVVTIALVPSEARRTDTFNRVQDLDPGVRVACDGACPAENRFVVRLPSGNGYVKPDYPEDSRIIGTVKSLTDAELVLDVETVGSVSGKMVPVASPRTKRALIRTRTRLSENLKIEDVREGMRVECTGWDTGVGKPMYLRCLFSPRITNG